MEANELKNLREKFGITQKELAEGLGTSQALVSRWENGVYKISNAYSKLITLFFSKNQK